MVLTQLLSIASLTQVRKECERGSIVSTPRTYSNMCEEALRCLKVEESAYPVSFVVQLFWPRRASTYGTPASAIGTLVISEWTSFR